MPRCGCHHPLRLPPARAQPAAGCQGGLAAQITCGALIGRVRCWAGGMAHPTWLAWWLAELIGGGWRGLCESESVLILATLAS